ncbi:MAG: fatty acid desaturase [Flavobacteriales bacterium]|nr:fatty acid desaturase [Flavobacteriales bacterium]
MQTLQAITDPIYQEDKPLTRLDKFFISLIHDKRNLPFVYLTIQISVVLIALAIIIYYPGIPDSIWWITAITYFFFNNFVFKGSFGLMLHCTSHRIFFKKKYQLLNYYLPWFLGLFFGQTPETYYSHHIWMHHPENNLEQDKSSTMQYQRDSFRSFMKYFLNFFFMGMIELVSYFKKKNRKNLIVKCLLGEFFFFFLCIGLSFINFKATMVVFILPFLISRFIMMVGNWTQHAFVAAEDPGNAYKNSITCINVKYNHKCWNDGYHITHHLKPGMHWTNHPVEFMKTLPQYAENIAIVFQGIGFLGIFFHLMRKDYDKLAEYVVNINNTFTSKEEIIELMKHRTRRISALAA